MRPFTKTSAAVAWIAAAGGIAYGVAFAIVGNLTAAAILLAVGGCLSALILNAIAGSLGDAPTIRLAATVGTIGALAAASHGVYDLANQIHPPSVPVQDLPHPVDPRGFATFALIGTAMLLLAGPVARDARYGKGLGGLMTVLGWVSVVIFLGRLIILDPTNPMVRVALVIGVVSNTAFLVGLGRAWDHPVAVEREPARQG